ncbi:HD domain-containing phosphohydrolase [Massilia sp. R2A-15]|uniref:HD-GYP domain-containing protein n=1 Tax=Massilia sp. R2A-15 TaxID=3064278 RepID=UPI002732C71A|nr:HD domain-containing phosphohydrolase [Massilia sp. R2A-15]WLI89020.1 HD domain-containing phosphohydrolase [Massilia sp. R2A-15]
MSIVPLTTAVNKHLLRRLLQLAQARRITATQDIVDIHGALVVANGTHLEADHFDALAGRKLKKTIESSLRVEHPVDTPLIVDTARRIIDTSVPVRRILRAAGASSPLELLAAMTFNEPMRLLLTLVHNEGPHALEHAVSVSLLSLGMAATLRLPAEEQFAAGLAGLLHDIGELYIAPAWLEPGKRLAPHEWAQLVIHPRLGQMLVAELADYPPSVARAIAEHHERCDGTGYPRQAPGKHISAPGQAVLVAEMIAGVLGKDHPLERAELALKIVPGEHARDLVSAISGALRQEARQAPAAHEEMSGTEEPQRLHRRIAAALDLGDQLLGGPGAKSPHSTEMLGQMLVRIETIQRAFISTGLSHDIGLVDDGVLLFEKSVATREIQWRLRDIARDLALHSAGSPDEKALFAGLIALLDDDSDGPLAHEAKNAPAPKLAARLPASFAGSLAYAS